MLRLFDSAVAGLSCGADRNALSASTAMMGLSMLPHLRPAPLDFHADTVRLACRMLEANLHKDISLEDVASKLGVGYHSLRKKFADQTGLSLHQYRLNQRLSRAKVLLQSHRLSIEAVAERVGFSDPLYFSRFFKSREGVSPSEYLKHKLNS
jgi:AraC-like DNA-binding protein